MLDELLVGLGFKYDPEDVKKFKDDLSKTTDLVSKITKAAIGAATAITGMTIASTKASDEQGKLSNQIGVSVEEIDALQFALTRAGGSSDGMSSSLKTLTIRAAEAARGIGSGVEAFGILGISATNSNGEVKKSSDLMLEISNRMMGLSKAKQVELSDKLGIGDSILLLQEGPKAIRDLISEAELLGVTTSEDAKIAADLQDNLTDLWKVVKSGSRVLSREFAPIISSVITDMTSWWKENRKMIEQNLPEWIDKAAKAFKILSIVTGIWLAMKLPSYLLLAANLFSTLLSRVLAFGATLLSIPAIIGLAITAIGLLAEDAKAFFEGGDSFIGDMLDKYPKWSAEIKIAASLLATMYDITMSIFDGWSKIFDLFDKISLDGIKETLSNIPGFLGDITGLYTVEGNGILQDTPIPNNTISPSEINNNSSSKSIRVDKIEIPVYNNSSDPGQVADAVYNVFQQASQDLNSAVDQ